LIAWWTGGAWVLYFADAPTLVHKLATFAPGCGQAYMWIGIFTFTTYVLAESCVSRHASICVLATHPGGVDR